jgi:predicted transposase/invertase (TIGR01784 family)
MKSIDIKNNALCRWLTYFDEKTPENELMEVINMDAAIQKANDRLNFVTQDKDFLRNYHRRIMEESDRIIELNTAMEKGMEKGGNAKSFDIAKRALAKGLSIDVIQDITSLKVEDIISLQSKK